MHKPLFQRFFSLSLFFFFISYPFIIFPIFFFMKNLKFWYIQNCWKHSWKIVCSLLRKYDTQFHFVYRIYCATFTSWFFLFFSFCIFVHFVFAFSFSLVQFPVKIFLQLQFSFGSIFYFFMCRFFVLVVFVVVIVAEQRRKNVLPFNLLVERLRNDGRRQK